MKLLMLKGLPASGKSTYAKKLAQDGYVRVNKDDLRAMLHAGKWSKINEKQVLATRDQIVRDSLFAGKSVKW
jgi:predicted kinase